jgi:hypothetical protein
MILRTNPGTGEWTVATVGQAMLAVDDPGRAGDLIARLAGPDGFRATLERLVSGGIAGAPEFALIETTAGAVRVVLRGAAEVDAGAERISGAGVTAWTERLLEGVDEVRLRVPGSRWTLLPGGDAAASGTRLGESDVHTTLVPVRESAADDEPPAPAVRPADDEPYAFLFGDTVLVDPAERQPEDSEREDAPTPAASGPALSLELPGGEVEPLSAPLLVGRSPSDPGHDASGGVPRLVVVAAGDKDISRTHARIEVAGGVVVVTDLDSKNGTSVTMPGAAPRRLRAGEPAVVLPDTVIDLGGGVTMTVRETA